MKKTVFNLIVVDESGSMSVIRKQALAGMNETLQTIKELQKTSNGEIEQRVTLILFDSTHCTFALSNASVDHIRPMTMKDYNPCGATPLYDAIGRGISHINAIASADDHVLVTIITDGMENCSTEYSLSMIRNLIEKLKQQNWTFTFIGTDNLDVESVAQSLNIDNSLAFQETEQGTQQMFAHELAARREYCRRVKDNEAMAEGDYFKF